MRRETARVVAWVSTALMIGGILFAALFGGAEFWRPEGSGGIWAIPFVAGGLTGALIVGRRPDHVIGRLFLGFGVAGGLAFVLLPLAVRLRPDDPDLAGILDAIGSMLTTVGVLALPATLLRFPNGRLLSPRWRVASALVWIAAGLGGAAALLNGGWGGDPTEAYAENPLRPLTEPVGDILSNVFFLFFMTSLLAAGVSSVIRFRRSRGAERFQMKWLALSGVLIVADIVFITVDQVSTGLGAVDDLATTVATAVVFALVPVAVTVAILRYRLYDIDVIISRAVVFWVLAGFITLVYAGIVVGLGSLAGGSDTILAIGATAVVALAFEPVRERAQRWANRLVYGTRATPYEVLSTLTERLAHAESVEGLLDRAVAQLAHGTGADRAVVWVGSEASLRPMTVWPADAADPAPVSLAELGDDAVPVEGEDGAVVGALSVRKSRGDALRARERTLMADLAGSVALVIANLRLNEALAARAEELAVSRRRLVEAQDEERRRLERDLHDGAQQSVVSLKVKLGLAERMARQAGLDELGGQLGDLASAAQDAIEEIRLLAKGIYPPLLVSDGLAAALPGLADAAAIEVTTRVEADRHSLDAESAVYFCVAESLTNAAKAGATQATVRAGDGDGSLWFEVSDDGPGFDPEEVEAGSGLDNMTDRLGALDGDLAIDSAPGEGTTVRGWLPVP